MIGLFIFVWRNRGESEVERNKRRDWKKDMAEWYYTVNTNKEYLYMVTRREQKRNPRVML